MAANSLALFPEARAVRNSVLISRCSGEALLGSKSAFDSRVRTLSMDHSGIFFSSSGED